ncbi:glycosyltransferase family 8 protein [Hymenobacter fodinae]|uniref:Glycosyltransferase family 8 protein n=1 Tax=Hymenobacter fodinae TaxID=2510796 RepID=A0A4Z0P966_9BACT|nr:glycosyltransferase family 8 protein [Hymenobacter fodinae]TGE07946.1 glycosyltransferase family 8 protein [Hymenobacter fodinae]
MRKSIHIALAFDEQYLNPFFVLLTSIFLNNKGADICVHLIATGLSSAAEKEITAFVHSKEAEVNFYDNDIDDVSQFILPDHEDNYLSVAIYYRLFFPFLIEETIARLLYIDVDTLVVGDLSDLFLIDMQGKPVAAVTDTDMPVRRDLGIESVDDYFNSGVLLVDINEWKKQRITEKALQIIKQEPELIKGYPDQDALNIVLKDNWYKLPVEYNLMRLYVPNEVPRRNLNKFVEDQKIIHYNGKKPWFSDCEHRLRYIYKGFANLSPRPEAGKVVKVNLTSEKRNKLFRARMVEFYFDHPELMFIWRKLKKALK